MRKNLITSLVVGLVLILSTSANLLAKSDNFDKGGVIKPEAVIPVAFPEVDLVILSIVIPDDLLPEVTFSIMNNNGLPLDREGIYTDGAVDIRFMLTYIPAGEEQKVNYHPRLRDRTGTYTTIEQGTYIYKFGDALPADYDMDATHTLAGVATRDLRNPWELTRYFDNELYDFIPSGSGTPMPRDVVSTDTCNRCHDPLGEHGGRYQEVGVCGQCHMPDLVDDGVSYSFDVVIHRVHAGLEPGVTMHYPAILHDCQVCHTGGTPDGDYPMVAGPNPTPVCDSSGAGMTTIEWDYTGSVQVRLDDVDGKLFASGGPQGSAETGKWISDSQDFVLVDAATGEAVQEMTVDTTVLGCAGNTPGNFRGTAADQHSRWMNRPSRDVCGSCHANIDFENGVGHLPQSTDDNCTQCHQADSGEEYDLSVAGAHTVEYKSNQLGGLFIDVLDIDTAAPGDRPLVTFAMSDRWGPVMPEDLNRLRISLSGPNEDFSFYVQEDVANDLIPVGSNWSYRFDARIPNDATGSWSLGFEGRIEAHIDTGDEVEEVEDQAQNYVVPFAVTDMAAEARDAIVDDTTCENCHSNLTLHGTNRHDASGYCQTCHMADATDVNRRPEDGMDQSIHFKYMIHKIHRGADLARGYVVYGYGNSKHDYSDVEFPGDLRNCESCHEEGTYNLPLPMGRLDTVTPQDFWSPTMPEAAACLSCHDGIAAAAHAANNTGEFGEACAACHGEGSTFSVEEVHSRP